MPEPMAYERLLPCLLDRLTDEEPASAKEGRDRRVVTMRRYVDGVRRDLDWLLNSKAHTAGESICDFPEAARSVLNFGIPDLCGTTGSGMRLEEFERQLRQAILTFEPRLVRNTLSVQVHLAEGEDAVTGNAVTFEISGELWAQPAPEAFFVKTEVDLETGDWHL